MKSIFFSILFLTFAMAGCGHPVNSGISGNVYASTVRIESDSVVAKGDYLIEASIAGYWDIHLSKPVTPALLEYLKKTEGVNNAWIEKRYMMRVSIARMYETNPAKLLTAALDSFKE